MVLATLARERRAFSRAFAECQNCSSIRSCLTLRVTRPLREGGGLSLAINRRVFSRARNCRNPDFSLSLQVTRDSFAFGKKIRPGRALNRRDARSMKIQSRGFSAKMGSRGTGGGGGGGGAGAGGVEGRREKG